MNKVAKCGPALFHSKIAYFLLQTQGVYEKTILFQSTYVTGFAKKGSYTRFRFYNFDESLLYL